MNDDDALMKMKMRADAGYDLSDALMKMKMRAAVNARHAKNITCSNCPYCERRKGMDNKFKDIPKYGNKNIKIVLEEGAYLPEKAYRADAGYDLRTPNRVVLRRHDSISIDTGVHIDIPNGWYGKLESKSGLNVKHNVVCLGGVIDSGYTGSIVAKLYNFGDEDYVFEPGDKIVQIVFMPCANFTMIQFDELGETDRGDSGFGSTGR